MLTVKLNNGDCCLEGVRFNVKLEREQGAGGGGKASEGRGKNIPFFFSIVIMS